ncbi:MAG: DUF2459 domain-containing protein, partial [Steroidobacteraceae bacterium]
VAIRRRRVLCASIAGTAFLAASGCQVASVAPAGDAAARTVPLYVEAVGWHTELALPIESLRGALVSFADDFASARFLVFGWGQRDYYMAEHPTSGDLIGAALPGPAVMLVTPLQEAPARAHGTDHAIATRVSEQGADTLSSFVWGFLATGANNRPVRIAAGPYPQSAFYASSGTYSLNRTCNTWTAAALRAAGLPMRTTNVIFAEQVIGQLRSIEQH